MCSTNIIVPICIAWCWKDAGDHCCITAWRKTCFQKPTIVYEITPYQSIVTRSESLFSLRASNICYAVVDLPFSGHSIKQQHLVCKNTHSLLDKEFDAPPFSPAIRPRHTPYPLVPPDLYNHASWYAVGGMSLLSLDVYGSWW